MWGLSCKNCRASGVRMARARARRILVVARCILSIYPSVVAVMSTAPLRIGFLGAAWIAEINGYAILRQDESNCVVTAIASRSPEKAEALAAKLVDAGARANSIQCLGGGSAYQQLVDSENLVDAIYIPLPSALHKDWVNKTLEAGKHVLLEKPVALSAADFESMMKTAHRCGKLLMDGTMFVHTNRIRQLLGYCRDEGKVGKIQRIEAAFSFMGKEDAPDFFETNVRCQKDADPLGCIGDLGWYCVYMALLVFHATDSARPVAARAVDFKCTEDGVPIDASCLVYFEKVRRPGLVENDSIPAEENDYQQVLMWKDFSRLARGVANGKDEMSWQGEMAIEAEEYIETSLWNQRVMDALLTSVQKDGVPVDILKPSRA
eukprot:scaffold4079_cov167-Amphora_coffeaeformis.AAC.11